MKVEVGVRTSFELDRREILRNGEVLYHTEAQNSFRKSLAFDEILWGLNLRVDL